VRHPSEPLLVDLQLAAGATVELPAAPERGVFVIEGELQVGSEVLATNQLGVLSAHAKSVTATAPTRAMLLGGPPTGARVIEWNFVASSRERIEAARDRWKARKFPVIPTDSEEFIPYPT
jgi:redox-sensitive bicupin YhaK (pirin superfamily)